MFKITKQFDFCASHQLDGLPATHPCSRLHGHNYEVVVELQDAELNETGFVKDYRELDVIKLYIDKELDHRHLNDILPFNPTAENIAKHLFALFQNLLPQVTSVTVKETPKTAAKYEPIRY